MRKIKVALLEDSIDQLKERLQTLEDSGIVDVILYSTNSTEFYKKIASNLPDALLLDIDLGNDSTTGLEIAYRLKLPVLFVSAHNAKNLKDIEVLKREFDFPVEHITKPFTEHDFIKTVTRFSKEVQLSLEEKFLYLDFTDSKRNKIEIDSIVYLESSTGKSGESNNKEIYFNNRKPETLIDFSFSKMEEKGFSKTKFLTCHKSYRVNAGKIFSYLNSNELEVEILNKEGKPERIKIPVSENYQKDFKRLKK